MSKPELVLSVDYGQSWPLSDIFWDEAPQWEQFISSELIARLRAWARFFRDHADEQTGLYGSEENRRWFDLEGFALRSALEEQAGHLYSFRLDLWF